MIDLSEYLNCYNCEANGLINRRIDDDISLASETLPDLDRDSLLGDDVYETIHYYSRNLNRDLVNISPVGLESSSSSSSRSEFSEMKGGAAKSYDLSESSHSDIGYSSILNNTNNDESLTETAEVKKKESFCSYQARKMSKDETIGRSVSDSFLNRVKGFRFLKGRKSKNKSKSPSTNNYLDSSVSSQSKLDDSGVINYGSTDFMQLSVFDEESSHVKQFNSFTKKSKKNKRQDAFNPCCVG